MKVLIFGISGMLGSTLFYQLSRSGDMAVTGTARAESVKHFFPAELRTNIIADVDVLHDVMLERVVERTNPDVVINCVGLIKQLATANDPLVVLPINSMLPHRLAATCKKMDARLIHISTDCVFDGREGNYAETDIANATDLYGQSKYIGELHDKPHAITLRTSIVGHELASHNGLIEWFLSQSGPVNGFTRAVFSGLPTAELATVIAEYVLPRPDLHGLYHVAAEPISKFDLLSLVARIYGKEIEILPEPDFVIDRSLDSTKFRNATGYQPPPWPELVQIMKDSKITTGN